MYRLNVASEIVTVLSFFCIFVFSNYGSIINHCDIIGLQTAKLPNSVKKTQNEGNYVVQGHRGRYQTKTRMRLPISD